MFPQFFILIVQFLINQNIIGLQLNYNLMPLTLGLHCGLDTTHSKHVSEDDH